MCTLLLVTNTCILYHTWHDIYDLQPARRSEEEKGVFCEEDESPFVGPKNDTKKTIRSRAEQKTPAINHWRDQQRVNRREGAPWQPTKR